jgi:hypothetical protein
VLRLALLKVNQPQHSSGSDGSESHMKPCHINNKLVKYSRSFVKEWAGRVMHPIRGGPVAAFAHFTRGR